MEELIKANLDVIFRYALFITGKRELAMDLMQDTIVRAIEKKKLYNEQKAFRSWIFTMLRNNYINTYKKKALHNEITESELQFDDNVLPFVFEDKASALELVTDPVLKQSIMEAFASMSDDYRDVCYLVDVEGLSYSEVAEELSVPIGTVMSRLHRGRDFLKKSLYNEASELGLIKKGQKRYGS